MIKPTMRFSLHYFDRNIIKKVWPKMNDNPMEKASNMVMRIARNSIRNQHKRLKSPRSLDPATRKASRPGKPPYSWQPGNPPPFKQIYADWLGFGGVARIVGMVGYGENPPIPGLHEHGGWARRRVLERRPRRTKSGRFTSPALVPVVKMVKYPPRPFMWPALMKAKSRYPKLWENSLNRVSHSRLAA